ncbi:hypothetical protein GIB67_032449 [Kingdonia uniflora]|uniref:Uncharacterized protein n=1 Tax=Kingdonia uniflora TaxID=39325 RepID=A0A7J7LT64_9MAGN|nr:hypothetical protein GIB67_032449 [Kingdonia uniflora]
MTLIRKAERFISIVDKIKQKGINPSSPMFIHAVRALACMSTHNFERKWTVYREFGFSEVDILSVFRKQPVCMRLSEEKLRKGLHFFMKQLKWDSTYLSKYSVVLMCSMEKRVIPRCAMLEILILKGVLERNAIVGDVFKLTEKEFVEKFVIKY